MNDYISRAKLINDLHELRHTMSQHFTHESCADYNQALAEAASCVLTQPGIHPAFIRTWIPADMDLPMIPDGKDHSAPVMIKLQDGTVPQTIFVLEKDVDYNLVLPETFCWSSLDSRKEYADIYKFYDVAAWMPLPKE